MHAVSAMVTKIAFEIIVQTDPFVELKLAYYRAGVVSATKHAFLKH